MDAAAQAEVDLAAGQLAALLERHLPGALSSLSLVGSAVDGDYRPGRSDLDFVAVMRRLPTEEELQGFTIVHRLYAADPTLPQLDGIWITEPDLAAAPDDAQRGPATRDGTFFSEAPGNRNPVTWFSLRDQSRTILGELDRTVIWHDEARLSAWMRENAEGYWATWLTDARRLLSSRGLHLLRGAGVEWGVLGISRLYATLATGRIVSKSEAGEYARTIFASRWHPILDEALRVRRGEPGTGFNPLRRRDEALDYVAMAIEAIRNRV